ncbi:GNAT family N-acetyltransferase [Carboxydothermus hydrogenoformans]|uniref:Acetyltransferase, GNAT family n=1 Tax=Carboxydothermus hydrogenoformans (strain ATCC BAA-161 / DSM 6008 / Z-2901) TaxID=246194 RepID=Q3AER9_CARHZ|nr:GNAT family protein [Carboxydothermus hydrogenoformans]ABB13713.1 acetyltransferase, GNAT family [Carboxydothermus hydrogenoformans Z-2901]
MEVTLKNGQKVKIRKVSLEDAEELLAFYKRATNETTFLAYGPGEFNFTVEQEREFINGHLQNKKALLAVADCRGRIIGSVSFKPGLGTQFSHFGEMGIAVLQEFWGLGVGWALISYLKKWAKDNGVRKINLNVRVDNKRAISLYEKAGFTYEGRISRHYLINGVFYDSYIMGIEID